jgi:hypothetical protein
MIDSSKRPISVGLETIKERLENGPIVIPQIGDELVLGQEDGRKCKARISGLVIERDENDRARLVIDLREHDLTSPKVNTGVPVDVMVPGAAADIRLIAQDEEQQRALVKLAYPGKLSKLSDAAEIGVDDATGAIVARGAINSPVLRNALSAAPSAFVTFAFGAGRAALHPDQKAASLLAGFALGASVFVVIREAIKPRN